MPPNRRELFLSMFVKFGLGFLVIGLTLFASAGSLGYTRGWMLLGALAAPMLLFGLLLLHKDPETLARRLKSREPDKAQGGVIAASGLMFGASFVLAGLDARFGWSRAPMAVSALALIAMLAGYGLFVAVILQNAYASRVIEVSAGQTVIDTGLYGLVRHPMYTASLLIFLSMPLVLGSYPAVAPMLLYPALLVRRIRGEEALLLEALEGYPAYARRVRYRLLPFIW